MNNFPTLTLTFLLFWIQFYFLTLVFALQWLSFFWEILIVAASVSIDFSSKLKWDASFQCLAYDYSRADWDSLCDHLRDVAWEDIFKLGDPADASEFCEQSVQVEID